MANVADGATGTVATAPSPATSGTSLTLNSGEAARYPTPPFYAIAHPNNTIPTVSTAEKILVTAVNTGTDVLTIVRAQGIYTAKSIAIGWRVSNAIFSDDLNNASIIENEVPSGSINGSNTAFTIASAGMQTGSLKVYKNGVRLKGGGADFTQTATGFTMVTAPATGTVLLIDYIVSGALQSVGTNSLITDETPTGSVNGSNAVFTTAKAYIAGSLEVYVNGLKQYRTTDFTETTPGSGTVTLGVAPSTGDVVRVNYQYNLNPASNSDTVDGVHANTSATANMLYPLNSSAQVDQAVLPAGVLVQFASATTSAMATGTTLIPNDDTIPQNTEGDQYMSLAITPKSATNKLEIEAVFYGAPSNSNDVLLAMFQDSVANALAADGIYQVTATGPGVVALKFSMDAGTTSSTTFKLRAGLAASGTLTFNGANSTRRFGTTLKSYMTIKEYRV